MWARSLKAQDAACCFDVLCSKAVQASLKSPASIIHVEHRCIAVSCQLDGGATKLGGRHVTFHRSYPIFRLLIRYDILCCQRLDVDSSRNHERAGVVCNARQRYLAYLADGRRATGRLRGGWCHDATMRMSHAYPSHRARDCVLSCSIHCLIALLVTTRPGYILTPHRVIPDTHQAICPHSRIPFIKRNASHHCTCPSPRSQPPPCPSPSLSRLPPHTATATRPLPLINPPPI